MVNRQTTLPCVRCVSELDLEIGEVNPSLLTRLGLVTTLVKASTR